MVDLAGNIHSSTCADSIASASNTHDESAIQSSDSKHISVADIQRRQGLRLPVKRKLINQSGEDTDDSFQDKSDTPRKEDITSSESENDSVLEKKINTKTEISARKSMEEDSETYQNQANEYANKCTTILLQFDILFAKR